MCLAQFVMAEEEYADAYRDLSVGTRTHLIMDNGLAEEGTPLKVADLGKAIPRCEPSEVVLPDYLDPTANIKAAHYALHEAPDFLGIVDGYGIELMYVPHGNTIHEYAANVTALHKFDRLPDSFGISKFHDKTHILSHIFGRGPLAMLVKAYFPDKPIHYLGLGGPIQELRMLPNGRSCDTCYAYMAAAHDLKLDPAMLFRPPVVDYEHSATLNHKQILLFNANVGTLDKAAAEVEWQVW
jgi:hypothetical protein